MESTILFPAFLRVCQCGGGDGLRGAGRRPGWRVLSAVRSASRRRAHRPETQTEAEACSSPPSESLVPSFIHGSHGQSGHSDTVVIARGIYCSAHDYIKTRGAMEGGRGEGGGGVCRKWRTAMEIKLNLAFEQTSWGVMEKSSMRRMKPDRGTKYEVEVVRCATGSTGVLIRVRAPLGQANMRNHVFAWPDKPEPLRREDPQGKDRRAFCW